MTQHLQGLKRSEKLIDLASDLARYGDQASFNDTPELADKIWGIADRVYDQLALEMEEIERLMGPL